MTKIPKIYQLKVKDIYLSWNTFVNAPSRAGKTLSWPVLIGQDATVAMNACSQGTGSSRSFHSCLRNWSATVQSILYLNLLFCFSLKRSVPAGTPSNMAVFQPNGKHVLRSLKPCDLSSCTKRLEHFLALRNFIAAMCFSHLVYPVGCKWKLTFLFFFCFREIKEYFENSFDLYETLFKALKGESETCKFSQRIPPAVSRSKGKKFLCSDDAVSLRFLDERLFIRPVLLIKC